MSERDKLPVNPSNPSIHIDRPTARVNGVPAQVKKPTSVYVAHGAQPAEAELTDEDIKKLDLFSDAEVESFMHWEIQMIRDTPYDDVKRIMDEIRAKQKSPIDKF